MAITKEIDIKVNTGAAVTNVNSLNKEISNTSNESKKSSEAIGGITGKIDSLTGGAITKFKGMTGALSSVAGGFKSVGAAIALSGLGLLVITIAAVASAFTASEEGQNKFAKLMGVIGSVTGNLMDLLSDFGELVISVFENPKKALENFSNLIKQNIVNRFNGLLELIPQLGKAIGLLFEGKFVEAGKVAADAAAKVTLGVDGISASIQNATNKTKSFIAELEREAKIAGEIADKRAKADTTERNLIVKRAEADEKIAILREKSLLRDRFSAGERVKFLKEASAIEENITNKEIQAAILRRDAIIEENKLSKSNKDALREEEELKAKVIQLNTSRIQGQRRLTASIQSLQLEEQGAYKATADARKKITEDEQKLKADAIKKDSDAAKAISDKAKEENIAEGNTAIENLTLKYENERLLLEQSQIDTFELEVQYLNNLNDLKVAQGQIEIDAKKKKDSELKTADEKAKAAELEAEKILADAKKAIQDNVIGTISSGLALVGQLAGKSRALQATAIVGESAVGIAKIIINTQAANALAKANPANIPTLGAYGVTQSIVNTIGAGIGIASTIASTTKALSALGGGGSAPSAGSLPAGGGAAAPSFNLVQGTGSNQIAQSLTNETRPIQAFVVASSVTSQQELDRNANNEGTIG
jgi:hypothetical protein